MSVTLSPAAMRAIRESVGLSRPQVATAIGKTTPALEQFERGITRPNADTLGLLADAYGCSVGDFYDEDPGNPRDRYITAVCRLLPPMSDAEIEAFAAVVRARRTTGRSASEAARAASPAA